MITVTEFAAHIEDESPVFGENTVKVRLDNLGAGNFITMLDVANANEGEVRLDFSQLHEIVKQIKLIGLE